MSERWLTQPRNKARIKYVARFLLALYAMRTVNLSILATAFSGQAKEESNDKRLQRFMREFKMPYAQLALFIVKLLGVPGPFHPGVGSKELKLKNQGYPLKSVFRRGFNILCRLVTNFERFDLVL